jgi:hypothetical protein
MQFFLSFYIGTMHHNLFLYMVFIILFVINHDIVDVISFYLIFLYILDDVIYYIIILFIF